ncbi:MAG: prolyl-tRNA synthetase associated domain-containing protein [Clostridia bacterium]|nr:prolyl-tRNA synthetase associated domain-containing protein [Clostridia bacterium]
MFYKQEIYDYLKAHGIWYEITEHPAVFNMEELSAVDLPYPDADAKNLFVRDDKRKDYYLITARGDQRVDLKAFRRAYGTKPLTFVKPDELSQILGLIPGAVSPFGLLNDEERKTAFYIDRSFLEGSGLVGVHPNDNTATVWLKTEDLLSIIREHGNEVRTVAL